MSELEPAISEPIKEFPVAEAPVDDGEKSISAEKRAEICQNVASAACESCAAAGICPILALRSPNPDDPGRKPATPENLLADDKEGDEGIIFVAPELIQKIPVIDLPLSPKVEHRQDPIVDVTEQIEKERDTVESKESVGNKLPDQTPTEAAYTNHQPGVQDPEVEIAISLPQKLSPVVKDIAPVKQVDSQPVTPPKDTPIKTPVVLLNDPECPEYMPKAPMLSKSIEMDEPRASYEPRRPSRTSEPSLSPEPVAPVEPASPLEILESCEPSEAIKPIKPIKPINPRVPIERVEHTEAIKSSKIPKPAEVTNLAQLSDFPEMFDAPKVRQICINKPSKTPLPAEIISPIPSINPKPIPAMPLSIESILASELDLKSKPETPERMTSDKCLVEIQAPVSTMPTIEQPKLMVLENPEMLSVQSLQIKPQTQLQISTSSPSLMPDSIPTINQAEARDEAVFQVDPHPTAHVMSQATFQSETRTEPLKKEQDSVVVKTTPFHEPQAIPDIASSDVATLNIAVNPITANSKTEEGSSFDAEQKSLFDDEQAEPTTSGYGKSSWLSEVIGRLACAAA